MLITYIFTVMDQALNVVKRIISFSLLLTYFHLAIKVLHGISMKLVKGIPEINEEGIGGSLKRAADRSFIIMVLI